MPFPGDTPADLHVYLPCPECGHFLYEHGPHGCTKCRSNPGALVGNPARENPCCLSSSEVRAATATTSEKDSA